MQLGASRERKIAHQKDISGFKQVHFPVLCWVHVACLNPFFFFPPEYLQRGMHGFFCRNCCRGVSWSGCADYLAQLGVVTDTLALQALRWTESRAKLSCSFTSVRVFVCVCKIIYSRYFKVLDDREKICHFSLMFFKMDVRKKAVFLIIFNLMKKHIHAINYDNVTPRNFIEPISLFI